MAKEFTVNYQTNAIVRMAPYAFGFMLALFVNESIEKSEGGSDNNYKIVNTIRSNEKIQILLHFGGFALMLLTYLLIIPYLAIAKPGEERTQAYAYLVLSPFGFLLGLGLFLLPCFLQGESKLTVVLNRVLGASLWTSL